MSYKPNFSDAPEFSIIPDAEKMFEEITVLFAYYDPFFEEHLADFEDAEREFKAALKGQSDVSADEYLNIVKQEFLCELSAVAWKGFMWNLACFEKRASKELLYSEPEFRFGQEHLHEIPVLSELFAKDRAIWDRLTPEIQETLENVDDYYSYLRSPGLSIAHYWGFLWANSVLPRFIPGYTPDMKLTHNFERMIRVELDSFGLNPDDDEE